MRVGISLGCCFTMIAAVAVSSLASAQKTRPALAMLPDALRKAIESAPRLRYSGERIIEFRSGAERTRHVEYILKDGPRIRIWFPAGSEYAGQIIVEAGNERLHFMPDRNEVHVLPPRKDEALARLRALFAVQGKDRVRIVPGEADVVAGIRTDSLHISDVHGNPLMRLWIDPRTGLILRRELYDAVGALVGLLEFTRVDYNPEIRDSDFRIARAGAPRVTPEAACRRLMRTHRMLEVFLRSDEFVLESARILEAGRRPILVLTYQGDKGPISFYQLEGPVNARRLEAHSGPGTRAFLWGLRGRTLALVGAMSLDELRRLSALVRA